MPPTVFRRQSLAGCYTAMLVIGLLMSVYGPLVTEFRDRFELTESSAGAALGTQSVGAVIGVLLAQQALRRWGNRATVTAALALITLGAVTISAAPAWAALLAGTAVAGLGFGAVDSTVTQIILTGSGARGPSRANIAHAWFGIGTVTGPVLVAACGAGQWRLIFAGAAVVTVVAAWAATGLAARPTPIDAASEPGTSPSPAGSRRTPLFAFVIAGFLLLYLTHFAVQSAIGTWAPAVLESEDGFSSTTATLTVSGYWLMMVVGRFGAAALTRRFSAGQVTTAASVGLAVAVALTMWGGASPWSYLLAGLFLGPIFPTGMAWMTTSGHNTGNSLAYVIAGAMVGMAVAPVGVGAVIGSAGTASAPAVFTVLSLTVLGSATLTALMTGRSNRRSPLTEK